MLQSVTLMAVTKRLVMKTTVLSILNYERI